MTQATDTQPRHGCLIATAGLAVLVAVIIVGALVLVGSGDGDSDGNSVAFQLAVTDGQLAANDDDPVLDPYRAVLRRLDDACEQAPEIADIAVRASAQVAETGSSTTRLAVLQAMEEAAPAEAEPADCASLADDAVADLEDEAS